MLAEELFLQQTEYTKVPIELKKRVYDALANVPGRYSEAQDIAAAFDTAPAYIKFRATLRDAKNNSSA